MPDVPHKAHRGICQAFEPGSARSSRLGRTQGPRFFKAPRPRKGSRAHQKRAARDISGFGLSEGSGIPSKAHQLGCLGLANLFLAWGGVSGQLFHKPTVVRLMFRGCPLSVFPYIPCWEQASLFLRYMGFEPIKSRHNMWYVRIGAKTPADLLGFCQLGTSTKVPEPLCPTQKEPAEGGLGSPKYFGLVGSPWLLEGWGWTHFNKCMCHTPPGIDSTSYTITLY